MTNPNISRLRSSFVLASLITRIALAEPTAADAQFESEMHEWESGLHQSVKWEPVQITEAVSRKGTLESLPDGSLRAPVARAEKERYTIKATTGLRGVTAFRLEVLPEGGSVGRTGNAVLSEFEVRVAGMRLVIAGASADFSAKGFGPMAALDGDGATGWAFAGSTDQAHAAVFELAKPLGLGAEPGLTFVLRQDRGASSLNRVRISATTAAAPVRELPESIRRTIALEPSERSAEQRAELVRFFRTTRPAAVRR